MEVKLLDLSDLNIRNDVCIQWIDNWVEVYKALPKIDFNKEVNSILNGTILLFGLFIDNQLAGTLSYKLVICSQTDRLLADETNFYIKPKYRNFSTGIKFIKYTFNTLIDREIDVVVFSFPNKPRIEPILIRIGFIKDFDRYTYRYFL